MWDGLVLLFYIVSPYRLIIGDISFLKVRLGTYSLGGSMDPVSKFYSVESCDSVLIRRSSRLFWNIRINILKKAS